jgi:hypothetical protein
MKTITTTALVALMTATIGLSAAAPAFAQDASPRPDRTHQTERGHGGMGGARGFLDLRNPDAVEIGLVRLSQRIELTPEQQPLFDAFKTAAMAAAEDFSSVLDSVRPPAPATGQTPTPLPISEMFSTRIAITTAQLDALKAVEPSATAFFDSLTDEQQAQLMPQRGKGMRRGGPTTPVAPPATPEAPSTNG